MQVSVGGAQPALLAPSVEQQVGSLMAPDQKDSRESAALPRGPRGWAQMVKKRRQHRPGPHRRTEGSDIREAGYGLAVAWLPRASGRGQSMTAAILASNSRSTALRVPSALAALLMAFSTDGLSRG